MRTFLTGVFHEKLAYILLERAGISGKFLAKDLTKADVDCLVHVIKIFSTRITGTKGFDQAQVSAGGIATDEVDSKTMESRIVPGLFWQVRCWISMECAAAIIFNGHGRAVCGRKECCGKGARHDSNRTR